MCKKQRHERITSALCIEVFVLTKAVNFPKVALTATENFTEWHVCDVIEKYYTQYSSFTGVAGKKCIYVFLYRSEEFEPTANSLGAHMRVTESSLSLGHGKLILRTFI